MKVLFISPVPEEGASYRYRIHQFIPFLKEKGVICRVSPFLSSEFYRVVYKRGCYCLKALYLLRASLRRLADLAAAHKSDIVFVHRESFPFGPGFFEEYARRIGRPIIFDFDDAIYRRSPYSSSDLSKFPFLKCYSNVPRIIRMSRRVIVSNSYLKEYSLRFNKNVEVIPTSVDTDKFAPAESGSNNKRTVIGWVGSFTTAAYLEILRPVLKKLARKHDFVFRVIGAGRQIHFDGVDVENLPWELSRDVDNFRGLDIGVYPLSDDEWVLGKGGFKTVQYMSVGVPCVVSNVGVNKQIIQDGKNGFLADTVDAWVQKLSRLIEDMALRKIIRDEGRKTVEEKFSLKANAPKLFSLLDKVYRQC